MENSAFIYWGNTHTHTHKKKNQKKPVGVRRSLTLFFLPSLPKTWDQPNLPVLLSKLSDHIVNLTSSTCCKWFELINFLWKSVVSCILL